MAASASFSLLSTDTGALERPLAAAAARVQRPTLGFLFVSGAMAQDRDGLARAVRGRWPGVPTLVVQGAGVMNEQGEHEGQAAASGLLVSGPQARAVWSPVGDDDPEMTLVEQLQQAGGKGTALLFSSQTAGVTQLPGQISRAIPSLSVLGGGAASAEPQMVIDGDGRTSHGSSVGLLLRGPAPLVAVAPGCRVLGGVRRVTEARGTAVLKLDNEPALDALTQTTRPQEARSPVMLLLLDPEATDEQASAEPLRRARLRPVRGVDPGRRALVLSESLKAGDRVAFAILDGPSARQSLDGALRDLDRRMAGAAARFGLYINCAGRGASLYGNPDVDCKMLRGRFPNLPFAGLMSSFEVAPVPEAASLHFYTGVFALFTAPS